MHNKNGARERAPFLLAASIDEEAAPPRYRVT